MIFLALAFAVAGLYALSAAGDIKRLPLQRLVIIAIVVVYYIRTMSQGQVIDIMTYNSYSFTVLQFLKRKNRFRILKTRGQVSVSWTMPIHTRRYSLTVDSFHK